MVAVVSVVAAVGLAGCAGGGTGPSGTTLVLTPDDLPVYVATVDIPAGTIASEALADGRLEATTTTRAEFPENAIVSIDLIADAESLEVITTGAVITADMFIPTP